MGTYRHGQGEHRDHPQHRYVQLAFFDDTDTNQETLDIDNGAFSGDVDDLEVLDEGEARNMAFTFAIATSGGVEFSYDRDGFREALEVRDLEDLTARRRGTGRPTQPTETVEAEPTEDLGTEAVPALDRAHQTFATWSSSKESWYRRLRSRSARAAGSCCPMRRFR